MDVGLNAVLYLARCLTVDYGYVAVLEPFYILHPRQKLLGLLLALKRSNTNPEVGFTSDCSGRDSADQTDLGQVLAEILGPSPASIRASLNPIFLDRDLARGGPWRR